MSISRSSGESLQTVYINLEHKDIPYLSKSTFSNMVRLTLKYCTLYMCILLFAKNNCFFANVIVYLFMYYLEHMNEFNLLKHCVMKINLTKYQNKGKHTCLWYTMYIFHLGD